MLHSLRSYRELVFYEAHDLITSDLYKPLFLMHYFKIYLTKTMKLLNACDDTKVLTGVKHVEEWSNCKWLGLYTNHSNKFIFCMKVSFGETIILLFDYLL